MTFVIAYARKPGQPTRTLTSPDMDETQARRFCTGLGAHRVTLTRMDEDGIPTLVQRWENGTAKRKPRQTAEVPAPVVIEGEHGAVTDETVEPHEDDAQIATAAAEDEEPTYSGYCVKCKTGREFHGHIETTANGRRMAKGTCPVCGTKMNRILSNIPAEEQESYETPDDPAEDEAPAAEDNADDDPDAGLDEDEPVTDDENPDDDPDVPGLDEEANVGDMAVAFSEAVAEDAEIAPAVAEVVKPPRKRASRAKGKAAKAEAEGEPVPDAEIERVKAMKVHACPMCENPKVPVMEAAEMLIFSTHPDTKRGTDRCSASLVPLSSLGM